MTKQRILVAEDEKSLRDILRVQLESDGFEVLEACDGEEAVALAAEHFPDLILLDVMMPRLDGFDACRRLRRSFVTRHIPVIFLTAKQLETDKLQGLRGGANDYVVKPWSRKELLLRVHNVLDWGRLQRSVSPLTGLPGNISINEETTRRIEAQESFAMLQIDIDFFKAFNDQYGYSRGDQAIQRLARIVVQAARRRGDAGTFVGHIGGDDFLLLCTTDQAEHIGEEIIAEFNRSVVGLYDPEDRQRGYVEVRNRLHNQQRFPLMSLTISMVSTDRLNISHLAQLTDIAQELKAHGKGIQGSVLVGERRQPSDENPTAEAPESRNDAA